MRTRLRDIESLAEEYARLRRKRQRPVSVAAAIRAIRTLMPDCAYSDQELAALITEQAVRYGHVVEFDAIRDEKTLDL